MDLSKVAADVAAAGGAFGAVALSVGDGRVLSSLNEDQWFPLASAGKLAVGWGAVDAVRRSKVRWRTLLQGLELDPEAGAWELYPHMMGQTELELREVVEVMIGGLDHYYAMAVARQVGGWEHLQERLSGAYPQIRVNKNPYDPVENVARLDAAARLARDVALGYREEPRLWRPVVAGMVRQQFKADEIPPHRVLNVQGGLGDAAIDVGLLGDIWGDDLVAYAVAVKRMPGRDELFAAYRRQEDFIRDVYDEHVAS